MDDNSSIAITVIAIILAIVVVSLGGCHMVEKTNQEAIKKGLVLKPLNSTTTLGWTNP